MKKFLIYIFCLLQVMLHAQDTIYKRNGEVIPAKIIEINIREISYKKSSMLEGPLFISNKNEIQKIKYFTGLVDSFAILKAVPPRQVVIRDTKYATKTVINYNEINSTFKRGIYSFQGHQISDRNMMFLAAEKNVGWKNAEIDKNIAAYRRNKIIQYSVGFAGAFVGGVGLYASALGTGTGSTHDASIAGMAALASAGILVSSQIISFKYKLSRINNSNKVAKLYNDLSKINHE